MGLTGLFLVSFLFVHMSGNLLLFKSDGGVAFNEYTRFMTTNGLIRILEWVLFGGFIVHIVYAAILTRQNKTARPDGYAYKGKNGSSSWFSRNMGLTGTVVLAFLIVHLVMFWGRYKFGDGTQTITLTQAYEEAWKVKEDVRNPSGDLVLHSGSYVDFETLAMLEEEGLGEANVAAISMTEVVKKSFSNPLIVIFYVLAMVLLAAHLNHGFQSAFRTLGLVHQKYTPIITQAGRLVAIVVPLVFASMPIYYFITSMM